MIVIHAQPEFQKMRNAGKLAAILLNELKEQIKPNISTKMLDMFAENFINKYNVKSACYGYKAHNKPPFPGYICTSVNHVVCHGIPSEQIIEDGDIISIDLTLIVDGYHGDTCATFGVGNISQTAKDLIAATEEAMHVGIAAAKPDNYFGDIGKAISGLIEEKYHNRYGIVEDYCAHGIGKKFHQEPEIQHSKNAARGEKIKPGMFFTVEPMINLGRYETRTLKDSWTVISKDYSLSAQFEHTIGITDNGLEIFTKI